ncbi:MAG: hypothetical protein CMK07_07130 [Ponticaulis sp.]|nr:hypothetical protein [Ponticaulis sp.]
MNRYVMLLGIVVAGFLAIGMFQAKSGAGEGIETINTLNADIASIHAEIDDLQKKYEALTSESRIAELATSQLGMQPARSRQMINLETAEDYFGPLVYPEDGQ